MRDGVFITTVEDFWRENGRHDLPWRKTTNPYKILISEVMLQQTQVGRVIEKYKMFLRLFPTFRSLAAASSGDVIKVWQGLGYNRRALMLHRCAQAVTKEHKGALPETVDALRMLPGIGPYTAGAVMAFAFDQAVPMIETNIRRVYIHHFFFRRSHVLDSEILTFAIRHLAYTSLSPRQWYWALMDYGAYLAGKVLNPNRRSKHYVKQSRFEGSERQVRGAVVRLFVEKSNLKTRKVARLLEQTDVRIERIITRLATEGFIIRCSHVRCVHNPHWSLAR